MPSLGRIAASIAVAIAVAVVFLLWIGWPGFLAVGAGAIFGVAFLIVATALGDDPSAADAAWREQARDLVGDAAATDRAADPADDPAGGPGR